MDARAVASPGLVTKTLGLDFGADSCRQLMCRAPDGWHGACASTRAWPLTVQAVVDLATVRQDRSKPRTTIHGAPSHSLVPSFGGCAPSRGGLSKKMLVVV